MRHAFAEARKLNDWVKRPELGQALLPFHILERHGWPKPHQFQDGVCHRFGGLVCVGAGGPSLAISLIVNIVRARISYASS